MFQIYKYLDISKKGYNDNAKNGILIFGRHYSKKFSIFILSRNHF